MRLTKYLRACLLALSCVTVLAACEGNVDPNATPIVLFPSAVPNSNLPTFAGIATTPPLVTTTAIPVVAPTMAVPLLTSTPTKPPTAVPPTVIPTANVAWANIADGIEYGRLSFTNSSNQTVGVLIARIDLSKATFRVKYTFGQTKTINDWLLALPGARVIVNASYFDTNRNPLGLVATDGNIFGRATGRSDAGFFQVVNGIPKVRSLFLEKYTNTERFDQVVEGFPMLVVRGRAAPAFNPDISNTPSRRTVFAQDKQGRILLMVVSPGISNFTDLANWLAVSGLELDAALNMDGGTSTAMYLATGGPSQLTPGLVAVPVVIAVYSK